MARNGPPDAPTRFGGESKDARVIFEGPITANQCLFTIVVAQPPALTGAASAASLPMQAASVLIDTGATISTLSPALADALALPVIDQVRIGLADGSFAVADVVLAVLVLPKQSGGAEMRVHDLAKVGAAGVDMLFGMDAMTGGTLVVATQKRRWHWRLGRKATHWTDLGPPARPA